LNEAERQFSTLAAVRTSPALSGPDARTNHSSSETFERLRPIYMGVIGDRFGRGLTGRQAASLRTVLRCVLEGLGSREEVPWASGTEFDADGCEELRQT